MPSEHIGERLKSVRKRRNLSVPQLSKLLDIPADNIYKWEKGTNPSNMDDYKKLEDFINNSEYYPSTENGAGALLELSDDDLGRLFKYFLQLYELHYPDKWDRRPAMVKSRFPEFKWLTTEEANSPNALKLLKLPGNVPVRSEADIDRFFAIKMAENTNKHYRVPFIQPSDYSNYINRIGDNTYLNRLESKLLIPHINPRGAVWQYWQLPEINMQPLFKPGDFILTTLVPEIDWANLTVAQLYVFVTQTDILIRRFVKSATYFENSIPKKTYELTKEFVMNPNDTVTIKQGDLQEIWLFRTMTSDRVLDNNEVQIVSEMLSRLYSGEQQQIIIDETAANTAANT